MASKQRDRFHFSSLFLAPKTSERKGQFHSFSSFVSKDRHSATGKQRTWVHERGNTVTCSLVWASCNTILLLQQNMALQPLLRISDLPLNLHSGSDTNSDSDITCGNISWKWLLVFHMSELGEEAEDLTFDYSGLGQMDKRWDTVSGFCWCH